MDKDKYGPWAVVAGGSEGVGADFADQLADAGINLVLIARKPEPLEKTAVAARAKGVEVRTLALDLTEPGAIDEIAEATRELMVGLLILNAGANNYRAEFVTGDMDGFKRVIDLNITTQLELIQIFGAPMKERERGGILVIGSMAGYQGAPTIGVYHAVKAFSRIFVEGLWLELRDYNVDVVQFVLGLTRTPAMERLGLNFDVPGVITSEPADVAAMALASLPHGPLQMDPRHKADAEAKGAVDRAPLLEAAGDLAKKLLKTP